jgi:hypothetical protein
MALRTTAQTPAPTPAETPAPAAKESASAKLPYGVDDVLKLSRAQVSEDVTLNYIHNSGTVYNLSPGDIVYLRNEGVSDRVINTMLDQRKNVPAEQAAQVAATSGAESTAPVVPAPDLGAVAAASAAPQYAPAFAQPAPVYAEPQPTYAPASTVYVIPYYSSRYSYANYSPYYYGSYYRYCAPSTVVTLGYRGGGRYGPYYRTGYRGYHGGGRSRYYGHH